MRTGIFKELPTSWLDGTLARFWPPEFLTLDLGETGVSQPQKPSSEQWQQKPSIIPFYWLVYRDCPIEIL